MVVIPVVLVLESQALVLLQIVMIKPPGLVANRVVEVASVVIVVPNPSIARLLAEVQFLVGTKPCPLE